MGVTVLNQRVADDQIDTVLDAIHQILAKQKISVKSVMSPNNVKPSRQILLRVAAAILDGKFPEKGDQKSYVRWFNYEAPDHPVAKAKLATVLPAPLDAAANYTRLPLAVSAKSASAVPPGAIRFGLPNSPWRPALGASNAAVAIPDDGTSGALFRSDTIGAVFGAYGRTVQKRERQRGSLGSTTFGKVAAIVGPKIVKKNAKQVEGLPVLGRIIGRFLLSTPININSVNLLVNSGLDYPLGMIYHRFTKYKTAHDMCLIQGDAESSRLIHSPIATLTGRDVMTGDVRGTVKVQVGTVISQPGHQVYLPCALLGKVEDGTGDCTMKDRDGKGGFIVSFISPDARVPQVMPLSGVNSLLERSTTPTLRFCTFFSTWRSLPPSLLSTVASTFRTRVTSTLLTLAAGTVKSLAMAALSKRNFRKPFFSQKK